MIGGQAGLAGHAQIGDKVGIAAQSGIPGNIKSGNNVMGSPAFDARQYFKSASVFKKLPDIYTEINMLRKEINELKKNLK